MGKKLIWAEDAILTIKTRQWLTEGAKEVLIHQLERLPSVQPQRMKGRWIRYPKICKVECDQCGKRFRTNFTPRNFCPSCGADMRGDEDEKTEHI